VGEVPRISKYREKILSNLSKLMNLSEKLLSIKSTTTDKLGVIGNKEGIACHCSVLIQKK
jgi:2-C-methyl-D-erythritol 2,4-cyclodiphosphate synthase